MILRSVFDHVTLRAADRAASRAFYEAVLGPVQAPGADYDEWDDFGIAQADDARPATRQLHVAFVAASREDVDAFWRAGVEAGYRSDGEPGLRPRYAPDYYGAFLLDPDGNSVEAVAHGEPRTGGGIVDHLWIGVADLAAARRFWATVAPVVGLRIVDEQPERFHVAGSNGRSFALVADGRPPTEHVHLAFTVADDAAVAEFHRVALAAGYRDNGAPGERPEYHPGYVGAFVLDPDGNNIEAVHHNR